MTWGIFCSSFSDDWSELWKACEFLLCLVYEVYKGLPPTEVLIAA